MRGHRPLELLDVEPVLVVVVLDECGEHLRKGDEVALVHRHLQSHAHAHDAAVRGEALRAERRRQPQPEVGELRGRDVTVGVGVEMAPRLVEALDVGAGDEPRVLVVARGEGVG